MTAKNCTLTQEYLKSILSYDEDSGSLTWTISKGTKKSGSLAGNNHWTGYRYISINNYSYAEHRIIWLYVTGQYPCNEIDHLNRIKKDNRFENLRLSTRQENLRNMPRRKDNKSGCTGVTWHKHVKMWNSRIGVDGKKIHLGYFKKFEDAVMSRKKAEKNYMFSSSHGE